MQGFNLILFTVVAKMLGVEKSMLSRYAPDGQNRFRCLKSKSLIPFDWVNDDFCDCPEDGSDEPSTNACRKGVFHCSEKKTK
jgi:alpha-glucosidase